MTFKVDLNCDMGESFGAYKMGNDEEILDYVTSANIACGFHAGDPTTMRKTVKLALEKNVGIGAHPGLQDLVGFGRRNLALSPQEAYDLVVYQIGALSGFVKAEGGHLQHVKAHGALYNMAVKDAALSEAIAEAVYKIDPELVLFGLSGSEIVKAGKNIGLRTANEVFSDRTYQQDGSLTPRTQSNALITDSQIAIDQVIRMVKENKVTTVDQTDASLQADTICIHGDGVHALDFAVQISKSLKRADINMVKVGEFV
ncbi:Lactam utilization protein LamB [Planococcus sp. PAMC 21323]|uniref:LamB/YcsF family protein n=1 Tax=Planococcus sp. PAMC 21323 TaxID=1526927 RepID=UPI00056DFA86|nr:5-oxoprolinase subunit PxpA [Planococcus sp. PAMC 21323]AIY04122.1 Lactam utilization protein LamB [Planococcus sp. PAMC 21323]